MRGRTGASLVLQAYFPSGRLSQIICSWQARVGQRPVVQARGASNGHTFPTPPDFLKGRAQGGGQPLPATVKSQMESFFQTDFSQVRVHVGPEASSIGALAFTVGTDLYFAPGQYQPNTQSGRQLLGHELTHVVQQQQGRVENPYGSGLAVVHDPGLEEEAERQGMMAAKHPGRGRPGGGQVQRRVEGVRAGVNPASPRGVQCASGDKPQRTAMQRPSGTSSGTVKDEGPQVFQASFVGGRPPARLLVQRYTEQPGVSRSGSLQLPQSFLQSLSSLGGKPLAPAIQAKMEKELGADFSAVRVHVGAQSARIGALAFTAGSDVYFAPGQFQPTTSVGEQLLRRQLSRVVQQRAGLVAESNGIPSVPPSYRGKVLSQRTMQPGFAGSHTSHMVRSQGDRQGDKRRSPQNLQPVQRILRAMVVQPPVLSAQSDANEDREGRCGYFVRVKNWAVANPVPGVIIQHVTRTFQVHEINQLDMNGWQMDAYVTDPQSSANATETSYWELWTVDGLGVVSDGGDDTFSLCAIKPRGNTIKNTTAGMFTMIGVAQFYPTNLAPAQLGFAQNAVVSAGGLFSTAVDPTNNLPMAAGAAVTHTVIVTWDSAFANGVYAAGNQQGAFSNVVETIV